MKNLKSFNETSNGEYHKALDSSSNKAINDRFFFDQDESSHWYMIPLSLKSRWLSLNSQNDDESNDLVTVEDYHLWLKLLRNKISIKFIPIVLGEFLIHGKNTSKTNSKNLNALSNAFELIYENYKPKNFLIKVKAIKRRAIIIYSGARGFQSSGDFNKSIILNLKAILKFPFILKFYLALIMSVFKIK